MDLVVVNFMEDNQAGVSRLISEFLHRPVTDLNQEIVNLSGQTMDELTMSRGEENLRQIEHDVFGAKLAKRNVVLTAPSHVLTRYENLKMLQETGAFVVVLKDQKNADKTFEAMLEQSFGHDRMIDAAELSTKEAARRVAACWSTQKAA